LKTDRFSSLLFIVSLLTVMLAGTQQSATSSFAIAASCCGSGAPLEKYASVVTLPIPDPRLLLKDSQPADKSGQFKMHLAMQLVNHPEFNKQQVQVIFDAISLSTPEFFADSNTTPANRTKADEALASLTRRAVSAFTHDQATQLFGNVAASAGEEDVLKMYYALSALSVSERRVAFRNASASLKSTYWKTHLALFFVKQELTEWQKELIWSAASLVTPEYFRIKSGDPDWEAKVGQPTYSLEQQIFDAFSMDNAARIFANLGDNEESARTSASVLLKSINYEPLSKSGRYKPIILSRFAAQDDFELESTFCECATNSDYCSIWRACRSGGCSWTPDGCGTFWSYPCNGACR
jgi:hypothetical protein